MKKQINFSTAWNWFKSLPIQTIFIVAIIAIMIFQKECGSTTNKTKQKIITDTIVLTEVIRDTTPLFIKTYYPVPADTIEIQVPANVDTLAILSNYYNKYYYRDTLVNDSMALIVIFDTITQNKIISRSGEYKNRRPTVINNTTIINQSKVWNIGFGLFAGGNLSEFQAGPSLLITTNNRSSYLAEYDIMHKTFRIGMFWNVR